MKKKKVLLFKLFNLPKFGRKGYGFRTLKILINFVKQERKISKIIANVNKKNYASIKIFKKLNFVEKQSRLNIITFEYKI